MNAQVAPAFMAGVKISKTCIDVIVMVAGLEHVVAKVRNCIKI